MQPHRHDADHGPEAVCPPAPRLLYHERERRRLVQQAQLALGIVGRGRIEEDAAGDEIAMEIGDEGPDVARVFRLDLASPFLNAATTRCTDGVQRFQLLSFTL